MAKKAKDHDASQPAEDGPSKPKMKRKEYEAPLTGESTPALKDLDVIDGAELGVLGAEEVEPGLRLRQPQAVHVS